MCVCVWACVRSHARLFFQRASIICDGEHCGNGSLCLDIQTGQQACDSGNDGNLEHFAVVILCGAMMLSDIKLCCLSIAVVAVVIVVLDTGDYDNCLRLVCAELG